MVFSSLAWIFLLISIILVLYRMIKNSSELFLMSSLAALIASSLIFMEDKAIVSLFFFLAMLFSFLGDLFMKRIIKITHHKIIDGILSFGVAHILYITGVAQIISLNWFFATILTLVLGIPIYFVVVYTPEQKTLSVIAAIYVFLIALLFSTSLLLLTAAFNLGNIILTIGILLFMISDSMIGYRQFRKDHPIFERLISLTYIFGQILIQSYGLI